MPPFRYCLADNRGVLSHGTVHSEHVNGLVSNGYKYVPQVAATVFTRRTSFANSYILTKHPNRNVERADYPL